MNKEKICSRCGRKYVGYPAISRKDNKTEICSECGMEEALEDYFNFKKGDVKNDKSRV